MDVEKINNKANVKKEREKKLSRREFLKISSAVAAGALAGSLIPKILDDKN